MSGRSRGIKRAKALNAAVLDLVGEFDAQCTAAGMSARQVDAHVASIAMSLLCLLVEHRETYSADTLLGVINKELNEAESLYAELNEDAA